MNIRKARAYQIRYILRRDLEYVCEFDSDQSEQELIDLLKRRDTEGLVAECNELIVGYCIYSFSRGAIRIRTLNVKPDFRRQGVASALIAKLLSKLYATVYAPAAYNKLIAFVPENNLDALNFFKSHGFMSKLSKNKFGDFDGIKMTHIGD